MVTCEACRHIFLIEMDGQIVSADEEPEEPSPSAAASEFFEPASSSFVESNVASEDLYSSDIAKEEYSSDSVDEFESQDMEPIELQTPEGWPNYDPSVPIPEIQNPELDQDLKSPAQGDGYSDGDYEKIDSSSIATRDETEAAGGPDEVPPPPVDPKKYEHLFASGKKEGLVVDDQLSGEVYYNLYIGGIETAEDKHFILSKLADQRLGISVRDLNSAIHDGQLWLKQVNPVKSAFILKRIRPKPFYVRWEQARVSDLVDLGDSESSYGEVPKGDEAL